MEKDLSMRAAVYGTIADKEKYIFEPHSGYFSSAICCAA